MLQMKINYIFLKNNLVIDNKTYTLEEIEKNNFNYKVLDKDEIIIKRLCTGKLDKNKKDIYEDDIVKVNDEFYKVWNSGIAFGLVDVNGNFYEYMCNLPDMGGKVYEIVGNIYSNTEYDFFH